MKLNYFSVYLTGDVGRVSVLFPDDSLTKFGEMKNMELNLGKCVFAFVPAE